MITGILKTKEVEKREEVSTPNRGFCVLVSAFWSPAGAGRWPLVVAGSGYFLAEDSHNYLRDCAIHRRYRY